MAIYRCDICDQYIDDDYSPCTESLVNSELICPSCFEEEECFLEYKELKEEARHNRAIEIRQLQRGMK